MRNQAPRAHFDELAAALLGTFVSLALMYILPPTGLIVLALLMGGVLGALWSRTTRLFVDGKRVRMCGTAWYLAVWALTLACYLVLTQVVKSWLLRRRWI